MRAFFAAVRAAIMQVMVMTWTATKRAGQVVWSLVPRMGYSQPDAGHLAEAVAMEQPKAPQPAAPGDNPFDAIRKAAAAMAAGSIKADDLMGMPPDVVSWLRVMPRGMLCKIACASDSAIDAHLHGRSIRGVLTYDRRAVEEYRAALKRKARRQEDDGLEYEYGMAM